MPVINGSSVKVRDHSSLGKGWFWRRFVSFLKYVLAWFLFLGPHNLKSGLWWNFIFHCFFNWLAFLSLLFVPSISAPARPVQVNRHDPADTGGAVESTICLLASKCSNDNSSKWQSQAARGSQGSSTRCFLQSLVVFFGYFKTRIPILCFTREALVCWHLMQ